MAMTRPLREWLMGEGTEKGSVKMLSYLKSREQYSVNIHKISHINFKNNLFF